jgi:transcriptional regulator GlxA family with amidase domain
MAHLAAAARADRFEAISEASCASGVRPSADIISLLEALDVRIAAGLTTLRRDSTSAQDHLDEARELIGVALRQEASSAWRGGTHAPIAAQAQTPSVAQGGLPPRKARRVAEYVDVRLTERICVSEMAALADLSRSHFCRAFRTTFGMPPHVYVETKRIERAQRLMLETDMSLLEIALACGYCDAAHFSNAFRRANGMAPSLWRRAARD